jgi:inosine triphosphate pyrophosphatase
MCLPFIDRGNTQSLLNGVVPTTALIIRAYIAAAMDIVLVTSNPHKVQEFKRILPSVQFIQKPMELDELQGHGEDIIKHKVLQAFKAVKKPVVVDDTGLFIEAWGNLPGMYVKDFLQSVGNEGIYRMLKDYENKSAVARCFIGYARNENDIQVFTGEIPGTIVSPRGTKNFGNKGWDAIFIPIGKTKTYGEMSEVEKDMDSHRVRALMKFKAFLENIDV